MTCSCRKMRLVLLSSAVALGVAASSHGQVAKVGNDLLSSLSFTSPVLAPSERIEPLAAAKSALPRAVREGWTAFGQDAKSEWRAVVDRRTGRISLAEGGNVAAIPGAGNRLQQSDIASFLAGKPKPDLAVLDAITRSFLQRFAPLLGADPRTLRLNLGRSGQPASHVWFVDYDVVREGLPVEGARVVFRYNNGNLVQWGSELLPSSGAGVPLTRTTLEQALAVLEGYVGPGAGDTLLDGGSLHLLPANVAAVGAPGGFRFGGGRGIAKVWQITFRRDGVMGTWRARVDAASGELLELVDVNDYAQVSGGVFLNSPTTGAETVRPMPYAEVAAGAFASSGGVFPSFSGFNSTLNGKYVRIVDSCGPISQAADFNGNIPFGTSTGTDCATPGHGGNGNTHAARTQFYQVNRAKEVARGWLPSNAWLANQLLVNVNLNQVCNAYWDGSLNFFKSGGGCGNTGEIAGSSLHEFGHGLDDNDGGVEAPERSTGEAYGDVVASIALHDSCIGPGLLSANCAGYGDGCTSCTGVRDIDFAKHADNTPATANNFTRTHCPIVGAPGVCSREAHCESLVASEAIWDFANRDLPNPGTGAAWSVLDRLWYLSRATSSGAFACTQVDDVFVSDGCNAGSWWKTMRAVDDDDGNLANGTPHSCSLFAAFDRHGIACADAGAGTCFSGCTPPAAPPMTLTAGDNAVTVKLGGPGVIDLYRNETGCNAGFTKIANDVTGTVPDLGVANGMTYYYQAVAQPTGNEACAGAPSACLAVTPAAGFCTPPAAPSITSAVATGRTTVKLTWSASAGAVEYQVFRATNSGGPYAQIATTANTAFTDSNLACTTTYYYFVRAANSITCVSASSVKKPVTTLGPPTLIYSDNFELETGLAGWSKGSFALGGSAVDWRGVQGCAAQSGTRVFRFGGATCTSEYGNNDFAFAQPNGAAGIAVPAGTTGTRLSFWHRREFESGFDGGALAVSVDGTNYSYVPAAALSGAVYNGTIVGSCPPAGSYGVATFTGAQSTFVNTQVDLDAACNAATGTTTGCAGRSVRIGFVGITDCSVVGDGWFLDDVTVTACTP